MLLESNDWYEMLYLSHSQVITKKLYLIFKNLDQSYDLNMNFEIFIPRFIDIYSN